MTCQAEAQPYLAKQVVIFLTNGIKLRGIVVSVNPSALHLTRDNSTQTIFYHAMASIVPDDYPQMD